ncbi:16S rRNA (adenine(1518)-N(6)/adenine(1519)-N(6))-dimethyltransferase, partial [Gammaproteobacteria bacterium]|nr:16S rRNA (adenine(1518)-N(6)/adenine(1519)-N(6))-dimethyltransferase [Gammaproteobacteria bacterium]
MQIRHKKSLGQNFLKDRLILERIVDSSEINPTDDVYEIGPGDGALTEFLFQKVNSITAYEIDRSLVPILNKRFSKKNLEIVN